MCLVAARSPTSVERSPRLGFGTGRRRFGAWRRAAGIGSTGPYCSRPAAAKVDDLVFLDLERGPARLEGSPADRRSCRSRRSCRGGGGEDLPAGSEPPAPAPRVDSDAQTAPGLGADGASAPAPDEANTRAAARSARVATRRRRDPLVRKLSSIRTASRSGAEMSVDRGRRPSSPAMSGSLERPAPPARLRLLRALRRVDAWLDGRPLENATFGLLPRRAPRLRPRRKWSSVPAIVPATRPRFEAVGFAGGAGSLPDHTVEHPRRRGRAWAESRGVEDGP